MDPISSSRRIEATAPQVYAQITDLRDHWRLADPHVRLLELDGANGEPADGATVSLRGPLGIRRHAVTRVRERTPPHRLTGEALVGRGTRAQVTWTLESPAATRPNPTTLVCLQARLLEATPLDRVVLALGGRWWLARAFAATLARLDRQVAAKPH
ncbi:MAG: SRPBCC family protein [Solirubrobacterales bacterium]